MITSPDPSSRLDTFQSTRNEPLRSGKIKSWHLDRAAIVYVRQSTPQQVLEHQESTARQYALADRAVLLGWRKDQVQTIDSDLGKSGQSIEGRPGFQRLLAEVALDRVGVILGLEMSRLARSCKDWHQLLELCARYRVLLVDADGVYDPNEYSDRLLLGLTGMMNEAELHILKGRMHQGKLNKARRGELVISVPTGYVKLPSGQVTLDTDEQVRSVVNLIFEQFERQGTVQGVLRYLMEHGIRMPIRSQRSIDRGQLHWRRPCRETVRQMLRHPIFAGAYRYGHRPVDSRRQSAGHPKSGRGPGFSAEECEVFLKDRFPAYITWERFEENQRTLARNRSRSQSAGAIRKGDALLAGLVWCGRCGRRMYVHYRRSGHRPTYVCSTARSDYGLPLCQSVSSETVEALLAEKILTALRPAALAASITAASEVEERRWQQDQLWRQRLERARFDADRAARQFHACEPENRLVARTLEGAWNVLLHEVLRLEAEFERFQQSSPRLLDDADKEQIHRLAEQVPALWRASSTTDRDRRQIARLLLDRVVLTVDGDRDQIGIRAEWAGGAIDERTIRRAVRGYLDQKDWPRLRERLSILFKGGRAADDIAATLNREGFLPPKRSTRFTANMVRHLLAKFELRSRVPRRAVDAAGLLPGEQWLHTLARQLTLSPFTLHGWRRKRWIHVRQIGGKGGPWAVWTNAAELARLRDLKDCPRTWNNRERVDGLKTPTPRR